VDVGEEGPIITGSGLTLAQLAGAKRLSVPFLQSLGVTEDSWSGKPRIRIPYPDEDGSIVSIRYRYSLDGDARFQWRKGDHVLPYGLPRLRDAYKLGWILLVEGESDCWTLWHYGQPALGIPGKDTWQSDWAGFLKRRDLKVFLWMEPDAITLVARVAADLPDLLVIKAPIWAKDINDVHVKRSAP
jgi:hypothetical protein